MKRTITWLFVPALLALVAPTLWADTPPARLGHSMVYINGDVYLFGGLVPGNPNPLNDLWRFDSASSTWSEVLAANPPAGRFGHTAVAQDGKMKIFGGRGSDGQPRNDLWEYANRFTNAWTQLPAANPPPARTDHCAAQINGYMVVVGGLNAADQHLGDTWVYDSVASSWTQRADFPGVDFANAPGEYNGEMYVFGEARSYIYNPASDNWKEVKMNCLAPPPRDQAQFAQDGDHFFLLGGEDPNTGMVLEDAWMFDFATQRWTQQPDLPGPRTQGAASPLNNIQAGPDAVGQRGAVHILIFGGWGGGRGALDDTLIYEPQLDRTMTPVPAAGPWGLVLLTALLGAGALWSLHKGRMARG